MALLIVGPALYGMLTTYALLGRCKLPLPVHLLIIGSAPYTGYVTLALLTCLFEHLGISWRSLIFQLATLAILITSFLIGRIKRRHHPNWYFFSPPKKRGSLIEATITVWLILWILTIIGLVSFENLNRPLISWDTINYWAPHSDLILQSQLSAFQNHVPDMYRRHPPGVKIIGAYASMISDLSTTGTNLRNAPWLMVYIGMVVFSAGFFLLITQSAILTASLSIIIASLPMSGSHTALAGYADLWLAYGFLICTGLIVLGSHWRKTNLIVTAAIISLTLSYLKTVGLAFSALLIIYSLSILFSLALKRSNNNTINSPWFFVVASFTLVTIVLFLTLYLDKIMIIYSPPMTLEWSFLHYDGAFIAKNLPQAVSNIAYSTSLRSSFYGLLPLSYLAVLVAFIYCIIKRTRGPQNISLSFTIIFLFFPLALLSASPFLLDHSTLHNETALTRLLLVIAPAQLLISVHAFSTFRKQHHDAALI